MAEIGYPILEFDRDPNAKINPEMMAAVSYTHLDVYKRQGSGVANAEQGRQKDETSIYHRAGQLWDWSASRCSQLW